MNWDWVKRCVNKNYHNDKMCPTPCSGFEKIDVAFMVSMRILSQFERLSKIHSIIIFMSSYPA